MYATIAEADIKLQLGDTIGAREKLDISEKIVDSFDSVESIVHASFYRVNAGYHKVLNLHRRIHLPMYVLILFRLNTNLPLITKICYCTSLVLI